MSFICSIAVRYLRFAAFAWLSALYQSCFPASVTELRKRSQASEQSFVESISMVSWVTRSGGATVCAWL